MPSAASTTMRAPLARNASAWSDERGCEAVALEALGTEGVHQSAQLLQCGRGSPLESQEGVARLLVACREGRSPGGEHQAEQRLRRGIVQFARDAVPLLDDGEPLRLRVELGVRDRHTRICREGFQPAGVHPREMAGLMSADEEVAEHDALVLDRDAEEVGECRVVCGVVRKAGMPPDVVEQDRAFLEQRPEHTVRARQLADRRRNALTDPQGHEARETAAPVGHPDGAISRRHLATRSPDDALEHRVEVWCVGEGQQVEHTGSHRIGIAASTHHVVLSAVPAVGTLARSCAARFELILQRLVESVDRHADLGHAVALADGHRMVVERVEVEGDRQRRPDLVLTAIATPDSLRLVVHGREMRAQVVLDAARRFDELRLLGQGSTATCTGATSGWRRSTTRFSPRTSSSSYASTRSVMKMRSVLTAGSMT